MRRLSLTLLICLFVSTSFSQTTDSTSILNKVFSLPNKLISKSQKKINSLSNSLNKQSEHYMKMFSRRESKLKRKILRKDSAASKTIFSYDPLVQMNTYKNQILSDSNSNTNLNGMSYLAYADSLQGVLKFMNMAELSKSTTGQMPFNVKESYDKLLQLQNKMQLAEQLKQLMQQRNEQIKRYLLSYGKVPASLRKAFNNYSKQVYYYQQQVQEYKDMLNHPDKLLAKTLNYLNKIPAFKDFMKRNSMLAGIFNTGGEGYTNTVSLIGLQARNQVNAALNAQIGAGINPAQFVSQQVQGAEALINPFKNMISQLKGDGKDELSLPNYVPNQQHTKKFMQRIEYGCNLQTEKSNNYFPLTTDLGVSIGYKLNDKSVLGLGASYKIAWGKDWKHINITNDGVGFRSYMDIKLRGSFYASGGLEYNYFKPFESIQQLKEFNNWNKSGLMGVSKIVSLKSKVFKKSKIQFLWDFLSYRQVPRTQAFKFRIGYNF